ncbi:hypothetical protein ASG75_12795 [Rhodanobacter sp. Soil772]|jgi:hypothetical protein|uniref:hypothetical protein n=1 Tax=Rhodanobacter sp. Soil772 TaxID=1736406 RepID=UPI0006FE8EF7|nr:hypothetical protein [Rhodanobacter sp. Soil772]KRE84761.1 hypothetical protein ASG75_12795 [Rhodanobacter sp. Soil772]
MSDLAYDISYLLDSEPATAAAPALRVARAAPAAPAPSVLPGVAAAQVALARELLQVAEVHEEWIRQYLHTQSSAQGRP